MLNNITWQGYWTSLALLSAAYYIVIYLFYFRKGFKLQFPRRSQVTQPDELSTAAINRQSLSPEDDEEFKTPTSGDEQMVYACMDELNAYFVESKRTRCVKPELVFALRLILSKYPSLRDSAFKESITGVIVSEAKQHCSVQLKEEEVNQVWLDR
jgi:hypothetical protein